jgi:hypothetical protein
MKQIAAAILIICASCPAYADNDASTPAVISSDAGAKPPPDRAPSLMTGREIAAYNKDIGRAHPYYITCRRDPVIGSLARKLRVCRTNQQWKSFAESGNDDSRAIMDDMSRAPANGKFVPF